MLDSLFEQEAVIKSIFAEEPEAIEPEVPVAEEAEPEVVSVELIIEPEAPAEPVIVPVAAPRKRRDISPEEARAIRVHYED